MVKERVLSLRILVVDDEEYIQNIIRDFLKVLGHEVSTASDGIEAVRAYREALESSQPFDAVIMDFIMPEMNGKDATQAILKIDPEARVIICSGYTDDSTMADFGDHGFKAVLPKPFYVKDVEKALGELFQEEE